MWLRLSQQFVDSSAPLSLPAPELVYDIYRECESDEDAMGETIREMMALEPANILSTSSEEIRRDIFAMSDKNALAPCEEVITKKAAKQEERTLPRLESINSVEDLIRVFPSYSEDMLRSLVQEVGLLDAVELIHYLADDLGLAEEEEKEEREDGGAADERVREQGEERNEEMKDEEEEASDSLSVLCTIFPDVDEVTHLFFHLPHCVLHPPPPPPPTHSFFLLPLDFFVPVIISHFISISSQPIPINPL